jgi:hypothetical protein
MKTASKLACILLLVCSAALPALADNNAYIYIRSNVNLPWGQTTNENAMDRVFGVGNWTTMYYETLSVGDLLTSATRFVFMEGGDSSYDAFADFISSHSSPVFNWVAGGGRLLIMAAPNNPLSGADLTLPDNILLHADSFYGSAASSAYAVDISNQIFSGPYSTSYNFTGDFFAHGYFSGAKVQPIMQSNLNEVVLAQDRLSSGLIVVGGLTTDNFHFPQPAAHALLINIVYYSATVFLY